MNDEEWIVAMYSSVHHYDMVKLLNQHNYGKWPCIIFYFFLIGVPIQTSVPIQTGGFFHSSLYVYQRVQVLNVIKTY